MAEAIAGQLQKCKWIIIMHCSCNLSNAQNQYSMYKEKHKFVIFLAKIFKMEHITFECA